MRLGVHQGCATCDAWFWLSPSCYNKQLQLYCYCNFSIIRIHVMVREKLTSPFLFVQSWFFWGGVLSAFAFAYLSSFFGKALLLLSPILRPQELFCWLGLYAVLSFVPLPSLPKSVFFQTDISSATIHVFLEQTISLLVRMQSFP